VTPAKLIHHRLDHHACPASVHTQSHPEVYQTVLVTHAILGDRYIQPKLSDQTCPVTSVSVTSTSPLVGLKFIHQIDSHHAHFSVASIFAYANHIDITKRKHHRMKLNIFVYSFIFYMY